MVLCLKIKQLLTFVLSALGQCSGEHCDLVEHTLSGLISVDWQDDYYESVTILSHARDDANAKRAVEFFSARLRNGSSSTHDRRPAAEALMRLRPYSATSHTYTSRACDGSGTLGSRDRG